MRKACCLIAILLVSASLWAQNYKAKYDDKFKYGYIDDAGKWVIAPQYDYAADFGKGLGEVTINGKDGLIDAKGKYIIPCEWDDIDTYYYEKGLVIVKKDNLYGLMDSKGRQLLKCEWSDINCSNIESDSIVVEKNNLSGAFNLKGEQVLPCKFDTGFIKNKWGYYDVSIQKRFGLYDGAGKELVPCKYDATDYYPDEKGFIEVTLGGKKGLCNMSGTEVIPCTHEFIILISGKHYWCKLNGKDVYYDFTGKEIVDPNSLTNDTPTKDGVRLSGNWSFSVDNSERTTSLAGEKIENKSSTSETGNLKLRLFLTDEKYSGGSISGYIAFEAYFKPLKNGYYYYDIDKRYEFATIPDGNYYATLCLLEDDGGYSIVDYLCFDNLITIDNSAERLQSIADALNQTANALNAINNSSNPTLPSPSPGANTPSSGPTLHKVREECSFCHGTGKNPAKEYPPSYGLERTYDKPPCPVCGGRDNHYHKKCPSCNGKGYVEKFKR